MKGRVRGLVLNLAANAVMLWGVASVLRTGDGWIWIVLGGVVTVACIGVLAVPDGGGRADGGDGGDGGSCDAASTDEADMDEAGMVGADQQGGPSDG